MRTAERHAKDDEPKRQRTCLFDDRLDSAWRLRDWKSGVSPAACRYDSLMNDDVQQTRDWRSASAFDTCNAGAVQCSGRRRDCQAQ